MVIITCILLTHFFSSALVPLGKQTGSRIGTPGVQVATVYLLFLIISLTNSASLSLVIVSILTFVINALFLFIFNLCVLFLHLFILSSTHKLETYMRVQSLAKFENLIQCSLHVIAAAKKCLKGFYNPSNFLTFTDLFLLWVHDIQSF